MVLTSLLLAAAIVAMIGSSKQLHKSATATVQDISSLSNDDYKALYQARSGTATAAASSNSQIKQIQDSAVISNTDFELLDDRDRVTVGTWGKMSVSGSWQEGYLISLTGGKIIQADVDRESNSVTSVNVQPRQDEQLPWKFSENQIRLITIMVNDPRFQAQFAGKSDAQDYYVGVARDVGVGEKAFFTVLSSTDNSPLFFMLINQKTGAIEEVRTFGEGK